MSVTPGMGDFFSTLPLVNITKDGIYITGEEPLFPGRATAVTCETICFRMRQVKDMSGVGLTAILYAGSAQPVKRRFTLQELDAN
jgi:hypothetical protein